MTGTERPAAVAWYAAYCYIAAAVNLALFFGGVWLIRNASRVSSAEEWQFTAALVGWSFAPVGLAFAILNFILPGLPRNRKMYTAHVVNIVLGLASGCLIPLCLPLLIAWFKPEVRAYFDEGVR